MSQEGKMMKSVECGTNTLCRLHVAHKIYIRHSSTLETPLLHFHIHYSIPHPKMNFLTQTPITSFFY